MAQRGSAIHAPLGMDILWNKLTLNASMMENVESANQFCGDSRRDYHTSHPAECETRRCLIAIRSFLEGSQLRSSGLI